MPITPVAIGMPPLVSMRMVSAAVCQPLAAEALEQRRLGGLWVEMERLRIELAGEADDLVGGHRHRPRRELLADVQVVEKKRAVHCGNIQTFAVKTFTRDGSGPGRPDHRGDSRRQARSTISSAGSDRPRSSGAACARRSANTACCSRGPGPTPT